jgi:hypothetical protein
MVPAPAQRTVQAARSFLAELERAAAACCAGLERDDELASWRKSRQALYPAVRRHRGAPPRASLR